MAGMQINMPKVYVHIGLPKTATTTLQADLFPSLEGEVYDYIGTSQPRSVDKEPLYTQLYQAIRSGVNISGAKKALIERLSDGKSIIFSEEMIVVSELDISWQEKIGNLAAILEGLDYKVLVTLREPVAAMFSFYVELYYRYKIQGRPWKELAAENNDFKIYHYECLYSELEKLFVSESISTAHFENIVAGNLSEVMNFLDAPEGEGSGVKVHNSKRSDAKHIYIEKRVSLNWLRSIYQLLGGHRNFLLKYSKDLLNPWLIKIRRKPAGYLKIEKPSEDESHFVQEVLRSHGQNIQSRHGVSYIK